MTPSFKRVCAAISLRGSAVTLWWDAQLWPMRLYSAGGLVMLVSVACAMIRLNLRDLPQTTFILGAVLLASGIVLESYRLADKALATRPGRVLAALAATMIGALSMGISSVLVNLATGFPPNEFPYTVTLLAPLTAGYLLLLVTIVLFVVAPVSILAIGVVSQWRSRHQTRRKTDGELMRMGVRVVAAITLLTLVTAGCNRQHRPYEDSLVSLAGWFTYTFEMYSNDACARKKGEHVRRAGSDTVLVGYERDGRRIFFARRCASSVFK